MPDRDPARHELPDIDAAALAAARAADVALREARSVGSDRWARYLDPLPDRLRDEALRDLRSTARRIRAAFGPKDSIRDTLPEEATEPLLLAVDRLLKAIARHDPHTLTRRRRRLACAGSGCPAARPSSAASNASSRNGDGRARVIDERERAPGPRPGDVGQAPLLLERPLGLDRLGDGPRAREATLVKPDDRDVVELETLRAVRGREREGGVVPTEPGKPRTGCSHRVRERNERRRARPPSRAARRGCRRRPRSSRSPVAGRPDAPGSAQPAQGKQR